MVPAVDRNDFARKSMSDHLSLGNEVKGFVENADACNYRDEYDGCALGAFSCYHCQSETDAAIPNSDQMNVYSCAVELDTLDSKTTS
ncbi:unnamed protein product [Sphenostylis stenocarpa]|uniref:Uncharacterized protein n=1 Tax=Sphenostylis stenocarpa TaxID=92480 RepID=A0AA86SR51_9FABA|nr:unnamed protein product [Sphenostylis stenocarpa]